MVRESLAAVERGEHVIEYRGAQMLKFEADLARYERLIDSTRPSCIVETGSHRGASARWFADRPGVDLVVSIDLADEPPLSIDMSDGIVWLTGKSSTDPATIERVRGLVEGHRTMVVLDSFHGAPYVGHEIELYGPLVSPGCALVVEDGLYDLAGPEVLAAHGMAQLVTGGPLAAVREHLIPSYRWWRAPGGLLDVGSPLTQNVDGWWIKL